jgi:hypothetical protein
LWPVGDGGRLSLTKPDLLPGRKPNFARLFLSAPSSRSTHGPNFDSAFVGAQLHGHRGTCTQRLSEAWLGSHAPGTA